MLSNWTKQILKKYNLHPNKRFGQNFLIKEKIVEKLLDSANVQKTDTVVEVGAGLGIITTGLAKLVRKVIAVEKDKNLIPILKNATLNFKNVKIIQEDILKLTNHNLKLKTYKLVGNIPYYLTAHLIRKFLESKSPPRSMTLMIQKEMAQRIVAKPPNMSILAVSVQVYAEPKIIAYIPRSSFWPQPDVDSAIIKIKDIESRIKNMDRELFFKIVKAGFSNPRKQLANNLSKGLDINREKTEQWLKAAGVNPQRRAETISVEEWIKLAKHYKKIVV